MQNPHLGPGKGNAIKAQIIADLEGHDDSHDLEGGVLARPSLDNCSFSAKGWSDNDLGRRAMVTIERTDPSWSEDKRDCNQTLLVFTHLTSIVVGQGEVHMYASNEFLQERESSHCVQSL